MRTFCTNRLKRSLSNPRTSGTWPDFATKLSIAIDCDQAATDEVLNYYLKGILKAQTRIYDVCKETDLFYAPNLSRIFRNNIYLKREDQHPVFSFKIRGSYNKIASLSQKEKESGIVTCSAGNHAQGVALSATKLGIDNLIVMPKGTPKIKVDSVRKFGGNVLLWGNNFDEAQNEALKRCRETGMTLIHPFDDFHVICGQGTIGIEILKQIPTHKPYAIFSCVGGGGLIAGVGTYIKQLSPEIKIIGSEALDSNALTRSLKANDRVLMDEVGLFADGAAVKIPGKNCFSLCVRVVDEMVNVTTDDICQAIKLIFNDTRSLVEPAGALSVAALIKYIEKNDIEDKTLVAILSGANMDFDRLRFVSERADRSESLIHVRIPEKGGYFFKLYQNIFPRNVTEFSYRMKRGSTADILLSFQAENIEDKEKVLFDIRANEDFEVFDFSSNEIAKTHIRHLSGGRYDVTDERLLSFEFPEGPGALYKFLNKLHHASDDRPSFNISLFHYRNHGNDVGRVLAGVQVPSGEEGKLKSFLKDLQFVYTEETDNPAYRHFLTSLD